MGDIVIDLYLANDFVFVCRAVPQAHGMRCVISPQWVITQCMTAARAAVMPCEMIRVGDGVILGCATTGLFAPPAGVAGAASSGRLVGHESAICTSGRWLLRSRAWNGSRHRLCSASERLSASHVLLPSPGLSPLDSWRGGHSMGWIWCGERVASRRGPLCSKHFHAYGCV